MLNGLPLSSGSPAFSLPHSDWEAYRVQFGMIISTAMVAMLKVNDEFGSQTMRAAVLDTFNNLNRKFEALTDAVSKGHPTSATV